MNFEQEKSMSDAIAVLIIIQEMQMFEGECILLSGVNFINKLQVSRFHTNIERLCQISLLLKFHRVLLTMFHLNSPSTSLYECDIIVI